MGALKKLRAAAALLSCMPLIGRACRHLIPLPMALSLQTAAIAQSLVTYEFSGYIVGTTISSLEGFGTGARAGDFFRGSFTYNSGTPFIACDAAGLSCGYENFITDVTYTVNGQTFTFNPTGLDSGGLASHGAVQFQDVGVPTYAPSQVFGFEAAIGPAPGDSASWSRVAGFAFGSLGLDAFATYASLPTELPPISALNRQFHVDAFSAGPLFDVRVYSTGVAGDVLYGRSYAEAVGQITSIAPVPEPSTYLLMIAGLGLMVVVRRAQDAKSGDSR